MSRLDRALSGLMFAISLAVLAGATGLIVGGRASGELGLDRLDDAFGGLLIGGLVGLVVAVVLARVLGPRRLRAATIVSTLLASGLVVYVITQLRY